MCGIIGAVAERNVIDILLEGLSRMEYRGYDSAGVALINPDSSLSVLKSTGNVGKLKSLIGDTASLAGSIGIAHTRWATHGRVTTDNAHPHISNGRFAVVHNGIIENHKLLRASLINDGYIFSSDTDTEVIAHTIAKKVEQGLALLPALQSAVKDFDGAYGAVVMDKLDTSRFVVARSGSPLVIGLGIGENFIASDQMALFPVTRKFMYLEEGDVAEVTRHSVVVYNESGERVQRDVVEASTEQDAADKSGYRHYMMKEMQEQPMVIRNTLKNRLSKNGDVLPNIFGNNSDALLAQVKHVKIVACGTSYHAGMVAQYWLEQYANVSCSVEIASEFRYRKSVVQKDSLFVTISQSGETADTLAALRLSKTLGYMSSLAICNVPGSSLVRESEMSFMTNAGVEIGVASTKAFTTQLTAFLMMTLSLGRFNGIEKKIQDSIIEGLRSLPGKVEAALRSADAVKELAEEFSDKNHCLFLGRGEQYPIAMEGALKLKEISYIHAEAYASGELKHGPLALIDDDMPVVVVAPNNELIEKLHSNIEEVRARGGIMYVFADKESAFKDDSSMSVVDLPHCESPIVPIVYTIPLQLLSYYVALIKGTDVDQPRNLAKSVSVE
jgi:glucosamine--fructose-6-phosphate aminotransferase (isomerizing)